MALDVSISTVGSLQDTTTAATTINNNFSAIQTAMLEGLSLNGQTPNQMQSTLDMNSNQIINLPAPVSVNSPARLIDVTGSPTISIPGTGTSGHVVPYLDGNNTWSGTDTFSNTLTANGTAAFSGSVNFTGPVNFTNTVTGIASAYPGWLNNSVNKTANYTVMNSDAGATFKLSGNTQFTLTYGSASGYSTQFVNMVCNEDSYPGGRGKILSIPGFSNFILWPGQNVTIFYDNGAWNYFPKFQRWRVPSTVTLYVDNAGSDSNDGLVTGSGALATFQQAATLAYYYFDNNGTSPIMSPTAGQTFVQSLNLGGTMVGNNLFVIQGNGGPFNWQAPNNCLAIGDHSQASVQNVNFISNTSNTYGSAAIYLHNDGLCDINSGITFSGNGTNDTAIFTDNGDCIFTVSNGFTVKNTYGELIHMDGGGYCTVSGSINPSGAVQVNRFIHTRYFARAIMGGAYAAGGWGSIGASLAEKYSLIDTLGLSLPGGYTTTTGGNVL